MSEFSQNYHLEGDDQQAAVQLLRETWLHPPNIQALIGDDVRPADHFAQSLGLQHFSWISWHYMTIDDGIQSQTPGVMEV